MLILALCGALCGFFLNQSASAKCDQSEALVKFIRFVRNQVECFGLPSAEIILACDAELLESCGFYNCSLESGFDGLARDCDIYDSECERLTIDFLNSFGRCYREEQIRECDYYLSLIDRRREELFCELPKKKKLNSTLCIACALCLALMLM